MMNQVLATPKSQVNFPAIERGKQSPVDRETFNQAAGLFRKHGYVLLNNSFDPDLIHEIQGHFLKNYANKDLEEIKKSCLEVGNGRFMFTVNLEPPYLVPGLYAAARVFPIVRQLLGLNCIIQTIGVVCAYPGATAQHRHTDNPDLYEEAGGLNAVLPPHALHVGIPLVDFNEITGTTALWDSSHRIKPNETKPSEEKSDAEMLSGSILPWPKIGDCYLWDFRLHHAGTPNLSSQPRPFLYIVYCRRWFQDRRNFIMQPPFVVSPEQFENVPEELRELFYDCMPPFQMRGKKMPGQ